MNTSSDFGRKHHPVFSRFTRWEGTAPDDAQANWLGVMTSAELANWQLAAPEPDSAKDPKRPPLPAIDNEEYPEWIDLLEAVCAAGDTFTMVELGAGYGRWLANGTVAYRQVSPDGEVRLVGVEAEPTHFRWLAEHLRRNGIDMGDADLIPAAVAASSGQVFFEVGDPLGWWGQSTRNGVTWRTRFLRRGGTRAVHAVTLAEAFASLEGPIDLVDLDVQGAEADVLRAGAAELGRVRRVHIGTHGHEPEERLRSLFDALGWVCKTDYPAGSVVASTWWGGKDVSFQDGVQSWLNPHV